MEFDESYNYEEIEITVVEEPFFSFPKLDLFTNSTYNTPVRKEKELLIILPTLSDIHPETKDDNSERLSSTSLNNNTPLLQRSSKIRDELTRYGLVAQHIALLSIAQSEICEPHSYNKAIRSLESHLWKQASDKEVSSLYENHIWDLVDLPTNTPILRRK